MTEPGSRRTVPGDPTAERTSDPVPDGEDILNRDDDSGRNTTPRRYEESGEEEP